MAELTESKNSARLWQGDCLELMARIPDGSVDMVLTDVPYGAVNRASGGLRNLDKGAADMVTFELGPLIERALRVCSGSFYIFCGTEQVSELRTLFVNAGLTTRLGVWEKTNPSPMNGEKFWLSSIEVCVFARKSKATFNEHCQSPVWRFPVQRGKLHPTQKSLPLFERLIKASTAEGGTVLDTCMGSGTTGVACVNTKRNFIGIELDAEYYKTARERIIKAAESPRQ
jgi:DNA modification methylase